MMPDSIDITNDQIHSIVLLLFFFVFVVQKSFMCPFPAELALMSGALAMMADDGR
jgi:hypothetical protein